MFNISIGIKSSLSGVCTHDTMYITSLTTMPEFRNQGHASHLLQEAIKLAYSKGLQCISVEDMSDNYRSGHNIYIKNGFSYVSNDGEMELHLKYSCIWKR
jgi:ribosomal protein S18 acetylase RimI-like enzyme